MKILRIRFENINSLKGKHEIDFQKNPLAGAGLFAITGATGSGKSSILDVITLALFCRIPRVTEGVTKGFIEKSGLVLTRNMSEAMAEVTYSCNAGEFTSQWSIKKNRNGNFNDYHMQISDAAGILLDLKKAEVPARNEAHIGLNFEQFVKAIILAQGDFAAFLKAKKDERGRLLEKVTGTSIYRELGKAAYQKNKALGQELEKLQSREYSLSEQLMTDEDYQLLLADIEQADLHIEACRLLIEKLKGQEKLKEDISVLSQTLAAAEANLLQARQKHTVFLQENGERMQKHARLLPYQRMLWDWKELNRRLAEQQQIMQALEHQLKGCEEEDRSVKEAVKTLTRTDAPVKEALEGFQQKVLSLQNKLEQEVLLSTNASRLIMADAAELSLNLDPADPAAADLCVEIEKAHNNARLEILNPHLSETLRHDPLKKQKELQAAEETLQKILAETALWEEKKLQKSELEKEILQVQKEMEEIPARLAEALQSQKETELRLHMLQKDKTIRDLTASLEEHRKKLVDGQPCPLCGAIDHPFSEGLPETHDDLEVKIKEETIRNEQGRKTINTLETTLLNREQWLQKAQKTLAERDAEAKSLEEKMSHLKLNLPEDYRTGEAKSALTRVKQEQEYVEQYRTLTENRRKLEALSTKVKEWQQYFMSARALSEELKGIYSGKDVLAETQALQTRFTGNLARQQKLLQDQQAGSATLREVKDGFDALTRQLETELEEYETPAAALSQLMEDGEYARLQQEGNHLVQDIRSLDSAQEVHGKNLKDLKEKDTDISLEQLQKLRLERENESREQNERRDGLKGKQKVQEKITEDLKALQHDITLQKQKNEKWVLLNKYIGDAEGKRFSTFAQELTLMQLMGKANKRLALLSERYRLAIPEEGEDDSLVVVDTHMGDMRRSVKSLSGGETFLVSLALALALSDLAAHKVEIKSLFIDEGFGSLDKLTLDQTMDTLEKLQYETSKTIGIISHVEAMQERITTQIKLEKGGQGHSTMRVAG